jgi:hypothetical protein
MPSETPETNKPNYSLLGGYLMVGFGAPTIMLSLLTVRMLFVPGRQSPALLHFDAHHPAAVISGFAMIVGLALTFGGASLIRDARRPGTLGGDTPLDRILDGDSGQP